MHAFGGGGKKIHSNGHIIQSKVIQSDIKKERNRKLAETVKPKGLVLINFWLYSEYPAVDSYGKWDSGQY